MRRPKRMTTATGYRYGLRRAAMSCAATVETATTRLPFALEVAKATGLESAAT
jgi:hypothetical protein